MTPADLYVLLASGLVALRVAVGLCLDYDALGHRRSAEKLAHSLTKET